MEKEDLWEEIRFEIETLNKNIGIKNYDTIIGSGNKEGDILFIGDDSLLYETEDLKVKIGSTGEFLIRLCDFAEISPDNYYITTLTKNPEKYRKLFEKHQDRLKELLHMQIALVEPKVIVTFGQDTAELLLEKEVDFKRDRGIVFDWKGNIKLIPTYDVGFAKQARENSDQKSEVANEFWKDLRKIKSIIK